VVLNGLRGTTAKVVVLLTLVSAVVLVQIPEVSGLVHLTPLHLDDWLIGMGGAGLAVAPVLADRVLRRAA
jgi:Ca2+-transporting ATPase